jgi:dTDP-4-dehydrorhamnose 3,5-epimerase-like enzyme
MSVPYLISRVKYVEENGSVTVFEQGALPFSVQRAFLVTAKDGQIRGDHAHRECWQALFCFSGRVHVETIFRNGEFQFELTPESDGVVIPHLVWARQTYLGVSASLFVLCSKTFSEADYIRTSSEFGELIKDASH